MCAAHHHRHHPQISYGPALFTKDGEGLFMCSDETGEFQRLYYYDLRYRFRAPAFPHAHVCASPHFPLLSLSSLRCSAKREHAAEDAHRWDPVGHRRARAVARWYKPRRDDPTHQLEINLWWRRWVVTHPKGKRLLFITNEDGISVVYVMDTTTFQYQRLANTPVGLAYSARYCVCPPHTHTHTQERTCLH